MAAADLNAISQVIQLSVAPVFLLTGIGALLGVMANRLARIVDRARELEVTAAESAPQERERREQDLATMARRARLINRAITLHVLAALLVCAVIVGLFVTAYYAWAPDLTRALAAIFAAALLALIFGLLSFLREVYLATQTLRIGHKH
jgi:hypothetical protein